MTRVLVVEDEPALARGLLDHFHDEGYQVRVIGRGDQAVPAVREFRPQLVVLDIVLPGRSGLDVLRELRAAGDRVPVLMLTAKGEVVDRVVGLELGADDYLAKPFALRELLARVHALMRRARGGPVEELAEVTVGRVRFDFRGMTADGPGGRLALTPHDILVFKVLALRRGEVVSRADIVEEVCGLDSDATLRNVDNHVMALRRALGDDPARPRFIHTVRGHGYRLARADGG
jgi:two-component system phosphate regulon response regulator OmpR